MAFTGQMAQMRSRQTALGSTATACRPLRGLTIVSAASQDNAVGTAIKKLFGSQKVASPTAGPVTAIKPSGSVQLSRKPSSEKTGDSSLVLVAGATGRTGARVVRELLKRGFKVRAAVRDVADAKQAVETAARYSLLSASDIKRLQIVEADLSSEESIKAAVQGVGKVVCALGASEGDALNVEGPKKVDGTYTVSLIEAARDCGVQQFVLVTSLGTGKIGFPASVLNLFWGILYFKRQAEVALEESGMNYTIVRPGGMERPKDDFKLTHNMVLKPRDTTFGGLVSRLQVAELIGTVAANPELGENKVLEVVAETEAPALSYEKLLLGIKPDFTADEQEAAFAAVNQAKGKADQAKAALGAAGNRVAQLEGRLAAVKEQEAELRDKLKPMLKDAEGTERLLQASEKASRVESAARAVLDAAKRSISGGQLLNKQQLQAVADQVLAPPPPKMALADSPAPRDMSPPPGAAAAASPKAASPFGGLFAWGQDAVTVEAEEKQKEVSPPPRAAPTPTPAPVTAKPAPAAVSAKPDQPFFSSPPPAPKAKAASPFGNLFSWGQEAVTVDADEKVVVSPKPQAAAAAKPPPSRPAQAQAVQPKAAPAAPAAPPKPSALAPPPVESAADVERRVMKAMADERRAEALAEAKAKLEAQAAAIEAFKAEAAKLAAAEAAARPKPPPEAPAPEAPAAKKSEPAYDDKTAKASKEEAKAWIAAWAAKQGKEGAAPAAPHAPGSQNGVPPASAQQDAKEWIAAWQRKQHSK